jgi:Opioid growth factor receptor (OGFr) conserved region
MSRLVDFYSGQGTDAEGRSLDELLSWRDGRLEAVHDFIQWLFPLAEPSRFNPDAPLLTEEDVGAFRADPLLRDNLQRSFERLLTFLGLGRDPDGRIVEGPNFRSRATDVWAARNHNWLRITRILRSLRLLGLEDQASTSACKRCTAAGISPSPRTPSATGPRRLQGCRSTAEGRLGRWVLGRPHGRGIPGGSAGLWGR